MTMPSQNTGIETPISASTVMARSDSLPALTADTTPTTIPKKSQMMAGADRERERRRHPQLDLVEDVLLARVRHELAAENIFCIIL